MRYAVALTTYNGSSYLAEQLNSILQQSVPVDQIVICDDASTDGTLKILNRFAEKHSKIRVHQNLKQLGVIKNFELCLNQIDSDFTFLSDQDDIWHKDKVKIFNSRIKSLNIAPDDIFLAYSDAEVVDKSLNTLSSSFMHISNKPKSENQKYLLKRLILKNWIPGCSCLLSAGLIRLSLPFPKEISMHDHWLVLVGFKYGKVDYMPSKLFKYRQHAQNTIGLMGNKYKLRQIKSYLLGKKTINLINKMKQAKALYNLSKKLAE